MINSITEEKRKNLSIERVRDWHREREAYWSTGVGGQQHEKPTTFAELHKGLADAIDADKVRQAKAISDLQDQLEVAKNQHAATMAKLRTVRQHILDDGDNHYRLAEIDAILDAEPATRGCDCQNCRPITQHNMRMILCPMCGNKRCPHANNHRNACTNSNAVGQPGSSWERVQSPGSLTHGG